MLMDDVPAYVFDDACQPGGCKAVTGYPPELLEYIYNKYKDKLPEVSGVPKWKGDRNGNKWTKKLFSY